MLHPSVRRCAITSDNLAQQPGELRLRHDALLHCGDVAPLSGIVLALAVVSLLEFVLHRVDHAWPLFGFLAVSCARPAITTNASLLDLPA